MANQHVPRQCSKAVAISRDEGRPTMSSRMVVALAEMTICSTLLLIDTEGLRPGTSNTLVSLARSRRPSARRVRLAIASAATVAASAIIDADWAVTSGASKTTRCWAAREAWALA